MIRLVDVSKGYGANKIIGGIDLQIEEGRPLCIVGRSGCGKSTLLKLIALITRPDSGDLLLDERSVNMMSDKEMGNAMRKGVSYSFQEPLLIPYVSVLENVTLVTGVSSDRATDVLGSLGLAERLSYRPSKLSGGEKKRVDLARALLKRSPVLVADEPLSNLDPEIGSKAMEMLLSHAEKGGTVVYSAVKPSQTKFAAQVANMGVVSQNERTRRRDNLIHSSFSLITNGPARSAMNRLGFRVGLALVVAGAPMLFAALVANLAVLPVTGSGVQSPPSQVLPPGTVILAQQVVAQVTDSRVLIALGAAAALAGGYLIYRKRNQEVRATGTNPLGLFLVLAALILLVTGLTLLPKTGSGTAPVLSPNFTQWSISTQSYLNTGYGSYVFLAILAAATLGVLLIAGARTTQRAASRTLQGEGQAQPVSSARRGPVMATADFGPDPRGTVLRSYRGISDSLQKQANLDASRLTAREFEARVGVGLKSARKFLGEATMLFEKAKYSDSTISQEEADRSVVCLENLAPSRGEVGLSAQVDKR